MSVIFRTLRDYKCDFCGRELLDHKGDLRPQGWKSTSRLFYERKDSYDEIPIDIICGSCVRAFEELIRTLGKIREERI